MRLFRCSFILACCLLFAHVARAQSYTFSALAGDAGITGSADGAGVAARFNSPFGVAVDAAGNIYVADRNNHAIRKITPEGAVSTLAGLAGVSGSTNGAGSSARFAFPEGIAVDGSGNLYVADSANCTVRKITPDGTVTTLAGLAGVRGSVDGTGAEARFTAPSGMGVDTKGSVYVSDNTTVRKISPQGAVSTLAGLAGVSGSVDGAGTNARFNGTFGIAVDKSTQVYVVDSNSVRKITTNGVVSTLVGNASGFLCPWGVAVDGGGNVYVADGGHDRICKITPGGVLSTLPDFAQSFGIAMGIAVDGTGNLFLTQTWNQTILVGQVIPSLGFSVLADRLVLSWPQFASNYVLVGSSTMSPGASWTAQTNSVGLSGDQFVVTNRPDGEVQFFRLMKPGN